MLLKCETARPFVASALTCEEDNKPQKWISATGVVMFVPTRPAVKDPVASRRCTRQGWLGDSVGARSEPVSDTIYVQAMGSGSYCHLLAALFAFAFTAAVGLPTRSRWHSSRAPKMAHRISHSFGVTGKRQQGGVGRSRPQAGGWLYRNTEVRRTPSLHGRRVLKMCTVSAVPGTRDRGNLLTCGGRCLHGVRAQNAASR